MNNLSTLLKAGITGTVISGLCCFTPILVALFGAVGLAAWVDCLDYLLMPLLLFFVGLTIYAMMRKGREQRKIR
ncbi:MAG: mercury resistance system transport protein MerF [Mariprofundaceae bacterium]